MVTLGAEIPLQSGYSSVKPSRLRLFACRPGDIIHVVKCSTPLEHAGNWYIANDSLISLSLLYQPCYYQPTHTTLSPLPSSLAPNSLDLNLTSHPRSTTSSIPSISTPSFPLFQLPLPPHNPCTTYPPTVPICSHSTLSPVSIFCRCL